MPTSPEGGAPLPPLLQFTNFCAQIDIPELKDVITLFKEAVRESACVPTESYYLSYLTRATHMLYEREQAWENLSQAIDVCQLAAERAAFRTEKVFVFGCLVALLQCRFQLTGKIADINEAVDIGYKIISDLLTLRDPEQRFAGPGQKRSDWTGLSGFWPGPAWTEDFGPVQAFRQAKQASPVQ